MDLWIDDYVRGKGCAFEICGLNGPKDGWKERSAFTCGANIRDL